MLEKQRLVRGVSNFINSGKDGTEVACYFIEIRDKANGGIGFLKKGRRRGRADDGRLSRLRQRI